MKKIIILLMILFLSLFVNAEAAKIYYATALTGGGPGALDKLDGASLSDKDGAIVITASNRYFYTLKTSGCGVESSPDTIIPDTNSSTKCWIRITDTIGEGWTDDGTTIRLTTSTDNVGIGTTRYVQSGGNIQAEINAITDASINKVYTIIVSGGIYNECITLKSYVFLKSESPLGATIKAPNAGNCSPVKIGFAGNATYTGIDGFYIDGNKDNQTSGSYHHGINVNDGDYVWIKNNYVTLTHPYLVHGTGGSGINAYQNASYVWIEDNIIYNIGDRAIQVAGENIIIEGNIVTQSYDRGVSVSSMYEDGLLYSAKHVTIKDNYITGQTNGSGIGYSIEGLPTASNQVLNDIKIINNTIIAPVNCGIKLSDIGVNDNNFLIEGNYIENTTTTLGSIAIGYKAEESGTATSGTASTLTDTSKLWSSAQFKYNYAIRLTNGTGSGQVRWVSGSDAATIYVVPNWTTNPNGTTTYELFRGFGEAKVKIVNNAFKNTSVVVKVEGVPTIITGNTAKEINAVPIKLYWTSGSVTNNDMELSYGAVDAYTSRGLIIANNNFSRSSSNRLYQPIAFYGTENSLVVNNYFRSFDYIILLDKNGTDTGNTSRYNLIASNIFEQGDGFISFVAESNNIIENNILRDVTASVAGTPNSTTHIRNNTGYITENSGTAIVAFTTTYIDVTHALALTPSINQIKVTATNDLGLASKFWISNVGVTTFRINTNIDPGSATATFVWSIL